VVKLADALRGVTDLGLDTAPVVYFLEAHPQYGPLVREVFQRIGNGEITARTSVVTLSEALVRPLAVGDIPLQDEYRKLLLRSEHLETRAIDDTAAERAADIRARYQFRLPDALQVAVALEAGCQALLTNDVRLQRVTELRVLTLDELEL
jgi:predicted nucleic acid-binding protein